MMMRDKLTKDVLKAVVIIVSIILLCRLTKGVAAGLVVLYACYGATTRKNWVALSAFILFPFFIITNPGILPKSGGLSIIFRVGTGLMALFLSLGAMSRKGGHRIPLGGLFFYLVVAFLSSIGGYCPPVSYMKIVNFFLFIFGIWGGTRNIHHHIEDLYRLRCVVLALCIIVVFGSYLTLPFPGIAYPQTVGGLMEWGHLSAEEAALVAGEMSSEQSYLAGVTNHSNTLAPLLACCVGYLLCDMLFVGRRIEKLHSAMVLLALPLMFFTRSRGAFVTLVATIMILYFYGISVIPTQAAIKTKARSWIMAMIGLAVVAAVVVEMKDQGFSRYLRKQHADSTQVGLAEAMTASRMGLIERNMNDFKRNPMLGMGFQTDAMHAVLHKLGMISMFSAPIEKGVLPAMILGETGILGALVFFGWLLIFWTSCQTKKYVCTICLMGVLLATNMGEASFFSPGGVGGILWIMTVVAGYLCDMQILYRRSVERQFRQMVMEQQQQVAMVR